MNHGGSNFENRSMVRKLSGDVAIDQLPCLCAEMDGEVVCRCPEHEQQGESEQNGKK